MTQKLGRADIHYDLLKAQSVNRSPGGSSAGSGVPGGSAGDIQTSDGLGGFAGESNLNWDTITQILSTINVSASKITAALSILGRVFRSTGTAIATTDVALGAGWGTNAVVSSVTGNDSRGTITVTTSVLDTPGAFPTLTLTFKNGTWTTVPFGMANMNDGSTGLLSDAPCSCTATTLQITYDGTPTALTASTYIFNYFVTG